MPGEEQAPRYEARFVARGRVTGPVKPRRVFTWRNPFRSTPRVAEPPGCPLQVLRPRVYSSASLGSGIATWLRFDFRNTGDRVIHSYFWRHASPVIRANGGFGCQPETGLLPDACSHEAAYLSWRGPLTITIDFVQFADGHVWLSSDPLSTVTQAGLDAGTQAAGDHLLRVWRDGGVSGLAAALPYIHRDVNSIVVPSLDAGGSAGVWGFYAGVTRAGVVLTARSDEDVEETLLALRSARQDHADGIE